MLISEFKKIFSDYVGKYLSFKKEIIIEMNGKWYEIGSSDIQKLPDYNCWNDATFYIKRVDIK